MSVACFEEIPYTVFLEGGIVYPHIFVDNDFFHRRLGLFLFFCNLGFSCQSFPVLANTFLVEVIKSTSFECSHAALTSQFLFTKRLLASSFKVTCAAMLHLLPNPFCLAEIVWRGSSERWRFCVDFPIWCAAMPHSLLNFLSCRQCLTRKLWALKVFSWFPEGAALSDEDKRLISLF